VLGLCDFPTNSSRQYCSPRSNGYANQYQDTYIFNSQGYQYSTPRIEGSNAEFSSDLEKLREEYLARRRQARDLARSAAIDRRSQAREEFQARKHQLDALTAKRGNDYVSRPTSRFDRSNGHTNQYKETRATQAKLSSKGTQGTRRADSQEDGHFQTRV